MRNDEARVAPGPDAFPDTLDDSEVACKRVNVAWAIVAGRLPWRTHVERIHALEAAGLVPDETAFPGAATAS